MRHFMAQFGPALQLPWTKLTDVPELTDELLDKLVAQSDAQAGGRSTRELERLRDDCLVSVHAGAADARHGGGRRARRLRARAARAGAGTGGRRTTTRRCGSTRRVVAPEWIDYNGHAHESRYLQVFGDTTDALLRHLGARASTAATSTSPWSRTCPISGRRARASGCTSRPSCSATTRSGSTSSTRCTARRTARCSRRPSRCCCTSTRADGPGGAGRARGARARGADRRGARGAAPAGARGARDRSGAPLADPRACTSAAAGGCCCCAPWVASGGSGACQRRRWGRGLPCRASGGPGERQRPALRGRVPGCLQNVTFVRVRPARVTFCGI